MKKFVKFLIPSLIFLSIFLMLIAPAISSAQTNAPIDKGLVQCGRSVYTADTVVNGVNHKAGETIQCDFKDFMGLINRVIKFILFDLVLPIAAIMFAYAGFLMVTSGGSDEQKTKAKRVFTSVAGGIIIAVAAWLIIRTILSILGFDGSWIGF